MPKVKKLFTINPYLLELYKEKESIKNMSAFVEYLLTQYIEPKLSDEEKNILYKKW